MGLDNIGIFDRSNLPEGIKLEEADTTSWMAMYAGNMLAMAIEIALHDATYEDMTIKFYEHFQHITEAFNQFHENKTNLWNENDGFFYDVAVLSDGRKEAIQVRSIVGLSCLYGVSIIKKRVTDSPEKFPYAPRMVQEHERL